MNFDRLSHVVDRSEIGAEREALLAVTIPEKVGSFRQLCTAIGKRNITELCTRFSDPEVARVLVGIKINGREEVADVLTDLQAHGWEPATSRITSWPRRICAICRRQCPATPQ